jgi:hypothetical protein
MNDNAQHGLGLDDPNQEAKQDGPVECLGKTFANDAKRREHYLGLLAEKLRDPEFRKIEGFPIGEDEDILELSDPPYYTACPNPFIGDFIAHYGRPYDPAEGYSREPYATDVSEGKSDGIYKAHSYHTKVPFKAIMRYLLHYTVPGDVVFDGFCGTGMTGVAAQFCSDKEMVENLGFRVLPDGGILEEVGTDDGGSEWVQISRLGARKVVLSDLSPTATFISRNYNQPVDPSGFNSLASRLLSEVEEELGWMYKTKHDDGVLCPVDYVVWSEVFSCPSCAEEIVFSEAALDDETGKVAKKIPCGSCGSEHGKNDLELIYESVFDQALNELHQVPKRVAYKIVYKLGKERHYKYLDSYDYEILERISKQDFPSGFPDGLVPDMQMMRVGRMKPSKVTHIHHFFLKRPLLTLASLWSKVSKEADSSLRLPLIYFIEQAVWGMSILARYTPTHFSQVNQYLSGVFYMASHIVDVSPNYILGGKLNRLTKAFGRLASDQGNVVTSTQDSGNINLGEEVLDYIFIDPPFGENIYYSDLNYLVESFYKVTTNAENEAIVDKVKSKDFSVYQRLMYGCFRSAYRALKPGRWITVEFSNSSAGVWNLIQTALSDSGFVISNVSALDKKQRSFQSIVSPTAVKQDLVISAYKPNGGFEERFKSESDTEGVWDFVRTHLGYLPKVKRRDGELVVIPERDPRILFDQVVSYFVRNLRDVPVSSKDFQEGLLERFTERDGMIFLPEQVAEYDKVRITSKQLRQLAIFVDDEASAIEWLRQLLNEKPQTRQDVHPKFTQELNAIKKGEEFVDLDKLLEQNFIKYDGEDPLPPQIHSYLSTNFKEMRNLSKDDSQLIKKAKDRWYVPNPEREEDLQKLRERDLLKQFEEYKEHSGRKLKTVRMEAVRCGFKKAWQDRDYPTIINVAEKIPQNLLQEDQKLLMWYDQAQTRHSDESLF